MDCKFLFAASVTIKTKNRTYSKEVLVAPWDAGCHPSDEELKAKFILQAGDEFEYIWDALLSKQNEHLNISEIF